MRRLWLKLLRRRRLHDDLEAELAFHRDMAAAHGNPIPLGNTTRITEQSLDLWRFATIENLWRDVVYAARGLRRSPGLVLSAIVSLGLGIGVNTAMFSLGVEFLLSEPSVRDPASLVSLRLNSSSHAQPAVLRAIDESGVFASVAGENEEVFVNWNDGRDTHRLFAVVVTKNYFTTLGIPMALGRGIRPDDPTEVAVLRYDFWRSRFKGDSSVVGRRILLNDKPYVVVGVLPEHNRTILGFGFAPDVIIPRYLDDMVLAMYARLKPGISLPVARAELEALAPAVDARLPDGLRVEHVNMSAVGGLARLRDEPQIMTVGLFFLVLLAVVGLVLLIACVNVAGLLLARASARRREIAVRLALGASRRRLLQQLLVESVLLALLGAASGLLMAQVVASLLARISLPLPLPFRLQITPDWRVAGYAALLTIAATLATGLLPAWQSVREAIAPDLARGRRLRLRRALVIGQTAVSVIVLATAVLFLRNMLQASGIAPGFDVVHTLRADVYLPPERYASPQPILAYVDRSLAELRAVPGITSAAAARIVPFTDSTRFGSELTFPDDGAKVQAMFQWNAVTPKYFAAMSIPLLRGRAFLDSDRGAPRVVVVNRTFVRQYLQGRRAVGATFLWGPEGKTPYQVVGVVADTKNMTIGEDDRPQLYEPLVQINNTRPRVQFVLRSATPPALQIEPVRRVLRQIEPGAGTEVATLYSSIGLAFLPSQIGAALLGSIGLLGLALSAVGLYGTLAYSVARRVPEIAVRQALGATPQAIGRMVLIDGLRLVTIGLVIGLPSAILVTQPLALFLLPDVRPGDPLTLAAVALALALTAVAASLGPVRNALRVEPMVALRED